ncbi:acyl-CoA dehydrogenase family protein [Streptomyces sp. SH5]|uniref:acyl-CoA dehydrogenase family protein n=1 Tax=Streptomyces sp. SH5 TaxID=3041765 RepID=UPI002477DFEF|nr:acyl-CoA dehydrogenase family protein [Streptomyces sp. SH5]WGP08205.1 acyl-CoA dehydrogenase family protein [Streptomyces sp. SH5]
MTSTQTPPTAEPVTQALAAFVHGGRHEADEAVRRAVREVIVPSDSARTDTDRARVAYEQLRRVVARLGPSRKIAADPAAMFALFDWAAVAAPDLFPILSGHFTLTIGALQRLGHANETQEHALSALDDAGHVGVFLLTELGYGSNVLEMRTEARWNPELRQFTLHTPTPAAVKFMPNVAEETVPRMTVVAARLIADGRDEGVFPFLLPLARAQQEPAGVSVHRLPDKGFCPMDNALIRFDGAVVPEEGWLAGDIAHFDANGRFHSSLESLRARFHHTIAQLQTGRVGLACGSLAAARAALWITVSYAQQRLTASQVPMIDRDNVRVPLALTAARLYAATALGNRARAALSDANAPHPDASTLAMLTKPLLSATALAALQECRERLGAQGMFRANMITDYLGITQGVITAEGDNQVLLVAAGRTLAGARTTPLPEPSPDAPAWLHLLDQRARTLLAGVDPRAGTDAAALAEATATAWAAHSLHEDACQYQDQAGSLLHGLAQLHGCDRVLAHADWYTAHGQLDASTAQDLMTLRNRLLGTLADALPTLTDAFGVTPDLVPSAFAARDYLHAWSTITPWHWDSDPSPS